MKPSILLSALVLASVQWPAWAQQPATAPARNAQSQERPLAARVLDDRAASEWGLQPQEWARYRELMDGPLGIYSPNLDPLSALGIEARTDEERRRYAELQVQVEARRVEKLLAYQRAYDEAWQRLNPGMQRVNLPDDKPARCRHARQRPHGGVRQGRLRGLRAARAAPAILGRGVRPVHGGQPPGRRAHPRLGQARADRPGARARRQHHAQPRRWPLAVAGPARRSCPPPCAR
jgi:hypothetical protein